MKKCPTCLQIKDRTQYYKKLEARDGLSHECKACRCRRGSRLSLKRRYGFVGNEYRKLLAQQGNKCAICLKSALSFKKALGVDHNHKTGKIRGLLCVRCNTLLGILESKEFEQFKPLGELYLSR